MKSAPRHGSHPLAQGSAGGTEKAGAPPELAHIRDRLESIRERIEASARRAGRDPAGVAIVAVTKGFPATAVVAAAALGLGAVGENRVQEARVKRLDADRLLAAAPGLAPPLWHLIGHLQRNKVGAALDLFDWVEAVDSLEVAGELSRRHDSSRPRLPVLVEIKTSPEPAKHGLSPEEALDLLPQIGALPGLEVLGLMTMAPWRADPRPAFRSLQRLRERLAPSWPGPLPHLPHLSMGMSGDFEVAVEEGATLIRLGTALFGPRPGDPA
jgi:pyridoxal phosphate enzyme (YggS family)